VIASDKPPYPGLRPFERNESHLFFGRDGCVDQMVARLAEQRFLAVLGSSGTGKSSLVKTGLFSALEMGLLPGAGSRWLIVEMRPGGSPLGNLARALLEAEGGATKKLPPADAAAALETRFRREGPRALIMWCREGHLPDQTNLLILVDQFEELFGQNDDGREDAQAFVSLLLESRWPRGTERPREATIPIYVAITMRSEYLGACALIEGLAEAVNEGTYLTPRMKRRELEEAIVGPARVSGSDIEPRLVTRILNDLADFAPWDEGDSKDQLSRLARRADQLPLMQHALNRMWLRASKRHGEGEQLTLTLADYRGLERELDEHAEQVYASLDASVKPTAECVFRAVTSGTTAADAIRRRTKYRDLVKICGTRSGDAVAAVIAAFGPRGSQFLTSDIPQTGDRIPDEARIDIAHESLIRQWKRLTGWVEAEGRAGNEWKRLKESAQRKGFLRGRDLSIASALRKSDPTPAWAQRYGGDFDRVIRLIKTSETLRDVLRTAAVVVPVIVVAIVSILYLNFQRASFATQNFELAITSAQQVADQVRESVDHGQLTASGARDMLRVAKEITENARDIDATIETTELLIKLQHSISDIYYTLGNYDLAYQNAERAKQVAEKLQTSNRGNMLLQFVSDTIRHPFRATNLDDPKILKLIYDSVWRMGDALSKQGKWAESLAQYREAWDLAGRLAAQAPDDGAPQFVFIGQKIGDVQMAQREFDAAIVTYRAALSVIEKLPAQARITRGWRRDEANTRRRIGVALVLKGNFTDEDFDRALEQFTAMIELHKELEKESPTDTATQSNLASDHQWFAKLYGKRRDWVTAASEYSLAIEIQERLTFIDPSNATWQFSLGVFHLEMGEVLQYQGKLDDALEQYRQAYNLRKDLARKDPKNADRQIKLANAAMAVAGVLKAQNKNLDEAVALYREAIAIQDETRPQHDDHVFDCYNDIGDILLSQGDRESALTEYTRAWSIANDIVADNRASVSWRKRLTTSYIKIGDLLVAEERRAEARTQYEEALKIVTDLAANNPQNAEWLSLSESLKAKIQANRV
jgi:tetratricopeptide (TPR) repeat protein